MIKSSCSRSLHLIRCKRLVAVRRISSDETDKPLNPFRKVIRRPALVVDYGEFKIANRICLSVLGNGAVGQPSTLCMFTDFKSYMFNCGEGVGRVFREDDIKVSGIHHVFITHKEWKKMSGLPDLYLSLQMLNRKKLTLHGPPLIEEFFGVTVSYHKQTRISKKPVENEFYKDDTLEVQYVPIFSSLSVTSQLMHDTWSTNHKHQRMMSTVPSVPEGSNMVVCYICKCLAKPRELALEKCVELGIPLGPLLLELKNGNDVTLPSGRKVIAEDVLGPADPGSVFLVVDCPSEHFLESFVNEEKFKPYQVPTSAVPDVAAIIHFTPSYIFDSYKYQNWISRFPPDTIHLVLNSSNLVPTKVAAHQLQHMLHLIHPRIFKILPKHNTEIDYPLSGRNIIQAEVGTLLHLRPSTYLVCSNAVLKPESYVQKAKEVHGFSESLSQLRLPQQQEEKDKTDGKYPEIIFLGTGSSSSSTYRGCSSILVHTSPEQSVMFDCGDGTFQQLVQYFGLAEIQNILRRISCVFISHCHTDHYMGLFALAKARKEAFYSCSQKYVPLVVTIPSVLNRVFSNFENLFGPLRSDLRIFRNSRLNVGLDKSSGHIRNCLQGLELRTTPVRHCPDSHGVILSNGSEWKIVYSGDCAPSQSLIDAGKDCTVLIHEATVEDELEQEASLHNHSTISQALDVAQQMNAQYTIVTHFCSHYVEVPLIKECYRNHNIGIAFDYMSVRLSELPCLPLLIPPLRCLFSDRLDMHHIEANHNANFEAMALKVLKS